MDSTKNQVQPEHFNTLKHESDCQTIREIVRQLTNRTFSATNLITEKLLTITHQYSTIITVERKTTSAPKIANSVNANGSIQTPILYTPISKTSHRPPPQTGITHLNNLTKKRRNT